MTDPTDDTATQRRAQLFPTLTDEQFELMLHYGKHTEFRHLMQQWVEAIARHTEFRQQVDPLTGAFTQDDPGGYSPAALVFLDFTRRLASDVAH